MSRRKHNNQARLVRNLRATFRLNGLIVVNAKSDGKENQGLMGFRNGKIGSVQINRVIADGISHMAHHWTCFLAVFCRDQGGEQYMKAVEIAPPSQYRADALADTMELHHNELRDTCNPQHVIGAGWIACPSGRSFTEADAAQVFAAMGVW